MGLLSQIKRLDAKKSGLHVITDEELANIQNTLLGMLKDFIEVFEVNNIEWSLSGGSVIGAVRHKGFIPWDDDIDIFMTRANFEKFCKVFKETLSDRYRLRLPGEKGNIMHFPTVEKLGTRVKQVQSTDEPQGLFMDIFILENAPDNKLIRKCHGMLSTLLLAIDSFVRVDACRNNLLKYGASSPELIKSVKIRCFLSKIFKICKMEKWMYLSDRCFSAEKNENTEYVVCPSGAAHYFGEIFKREYMLNTVFVPFEDIQVRVPGNADYYLRKRYGDNYMVIPSDAEKERHAYIDFEI